MQFYRLVVFYCKIVAAFSRTTKCLKEIRDTAGHVIIILNDIEEKGEIAIFRVARSQSMQRPPHHHQHRPLTR